jgi:uncharacterized lipoprotein YmbA
MTLLAQVSTLRLLRGAPITLVCLLAACATEPATRFHSLLPAPRAHTAVAQAVPVVQLWELLPVQVPAQLENPQWVVRLADDTLALLEYDRWIAPLAEEMRAAVALRLVAAFGPTPPAAASGKPWRIAIEVLRLDAALGRAVHLEAQWTLREGEQKDPVLRCHAVFLQPVGSGMPALGSGQRAAAEQLGDAVASALKGQLGNPRMRSCGEPQRG